MSDKPLTPEQLVTRAVKRYLVDRGWRPIRNQRSSSPGNFSTGEPGIPDYIFLRYADPPKKDGDWAQYACLHIWIEFKSPRGGLRKGQPEWHAREYKRGGRVWVVDSFDWFAEEYERVFGWLHSGDTGRGQLDLLAGVG